MGMRLHELHAALIHAPLTLIPAATVVDALAFRRRDRRLDAFGSDLWTAAAAAGCAAWVAGLAASQEVRAREDHARDMMLLHGIGNTLVATATFGLALLRRRRRAGPASLATAVMGNALGVYGGLLGGAMVYSHGLGVASADPEEGGVLESPPVLSGRAPSRLVFDAARGTGWMVRQTGRILAGRRSVDREALAAG